MNLNCRPSSNKNNLNQLVNLNFRTSSNKNNLNQLVNLNYRPSSNNNNLNQLVNLNYRPSSNKNNLNQLVDLRSHSFMDRFDKSLLKEKQIYLGTVVFISWLLIKHITSHYICSQNHFTVFFTCEFNYLMWRSNTSSYSGAWHVGRASLLK